MLRANNFTDKKLFTTKTTRKGEEKLVKLGRIRRAVFSEDGSHLVGYVIKQPDIVGMVKRPDMFVSYDALMPFEKGVLLSRNEEDSFDGKACKRLGVSWDLCVMWVGMDVVTTKGKELGYISDAEYQEDTGEVSAFLVSDGNAAELIVGNVRIPWKLVKRYHDGKMVVAQAAAKIEPSGGAAGAAGEGVARAKQGAAKLGKRAGKTASKAFDKGTHGFGKLLGKARNAVVDAMEDDEQAEATELTDVCIEEFPRELPSKNSSEPIKTYVPKTKTSPQSATKKKTTKKQLSAKEVGKHLGRVGGMFQAFKDEYDKASK